MLNKAAARRTGGRLIFSG